MNIYNSEMYPDPTAYHALTKIQKEEKAAKLGYSLISNHAFVDGNKRIGVYVMISFLELNGIHVDSSDEDVIALGLGLADGSMGQDDVLKWINGHKL